MKGFLVGFLFFSAAVLHGQYIWQASQSIPRDFEIMDILVKSNDSLYLFGSDRPWSNFGFPGVCYSNDSGRNWNILPRSNFGTWESISTTAAIVDNRFIMQVSSDLGTFKLYSSPNAENWTVMPTDLPNNFFMFSIEVLGKNELWTSGSIAGGTSANSKIYKSTNGGSSWIEMEPRGLGKDTVSYFALRHAFGRWFLCASDSSSAYQAYISNDGVNWQPSGNGLPSSLRIKDFCQLSTSQIVVVGSDHQLNYKPVLYISNDGGVNWKEIDTQGLSTHNRQYGRMNYNDSHVFMVGANNLSDDMLFRSSYFLDLFEFGGEGFKVYPNPASSLINIEFAEPEDIFYKLITIQGSKTVGSSFRGTKLSIDIDGVTPGIYILEIQNRKNISRRKIMIR